ncbi:MAG: type II secretion system F family protein [Phycisphaerales bacterium]|nr:type II secretion system F family protein [Phycisphaerales bacterium]
MAQVLAVGGTDAVMIMLLVVGPIVTAYGVMQLVGDLRGSSKKKIADRLRGKSGSGAAAKATTMDDLRKSAKGVEGFLGTFVGKLSFTKWLQTTLEQANMPWGASQVIINLTVVAAISMAATVAFGFHLLIGMGIAVSVFVLPVMFLVYKRKQRVNKLVQQLPDVFELLSQALRAGHALASGMQVIATELPDPAGTEFGRVFQEQNLGLKVEEALTNLADRMDVLDVRFFVTAVLIQRQTGGDLAEVLDKISAVIRDRIKLHGTVQALTAEGRLSGYVLLALPIIVYAAMLNINYDYAMTLVNHPTGQMMATFAVVSQIMGWVMIKKIINIKV